MGRRAETTDFLKECIADALLELMEERPIDKIRIADVTERAGVGRTTYFRHFGSKEELLYYKAALLFGRWREEHPAEDYQSPTRANAVWFFRFCKSIQHYIELVIRHGKLMGFAEVVLREYRFPELSPKERYRWCTHVYSLCGIIRIWAEGGFRESPEELVSYLQV